MGLFDFLKKKTKNADSELEGCGEPYEFCPRCEANLTLQKGYSNDLPYWICKGCGEMLINPSIPGNIAWICDQCETMLNIQEGFSEDCGEWTCSECGFVNKIDNSEVYLSDDEFRADFNSPYRGLSDEAMLQLSEYCEVEAINHRDDVVVVKNIEDGKLYVRKILGTYDVSVYTYLMENPIKNMPKVVACFEGDNNLIVIEEYIQGNTLLKILDEGLIEQSKAAYIARSLCTITDQLHNLERPIVHRDIKPSNIIISDDNEVYLLDMNVAKWYEEDEVEDTQLLGTQYYAAPEQLGYGFSASSDKSDIYAIGMLLNVMITRKLPKEEKAPDPIWSIVEKCICLDPDGRYSDKELMAALDNILR